MVVCFAMTPEAPAQPLIYSVTAHLADNDLAAEYIAWLEGGHLEDVIKGGAASAELSMQDPDGTGDDSECVRVVSRYVFANREKYEAYVRDHAPGLRAQGLAKFGPSLGSKQVRFTRSVGVLLSTRGVSATP